MGSYVGGAELDPEVARMRQARGRAVVLKTRLMTFRSQNATVFILVFEGPDDPIVYSQWIRRIVNDFHYEYIVAKGKGPLLEFMAMMDRDLNGGGDNLLYFIDHDFDGTRGYASERLFVTDTYSVENYLVDRVVVDQILRTAFHCALNPDTRSAVLKIFEDLYEKFLELSIELNQRIHAARMLKIELNRALPDRINLISNVSLHSVNKSDPAPDKLVQLDREPTKAEWDYLRVMFDQLEPKKSYRGKFGILFMDKWLRVLAEEYKANEKGLFTKFEGDLRVRYDEFNLGSYAAKSNMPEGLAAFIRQARQ